MVVQRTDRVFRMSVLMASLHLPLGRARRVDRASMAG